MSDAAATSGPGALTLAIDIGGSKIAAGLVDGRGSVLAGQRCPTPRTGGADVMVRVCAVVAELVARADVLGRRVKGIGVGAPGTIDIVAGRVLAATDVLPGWVGTDVAGPLRSVLDVPVVIDNDVRATGLAEARFGAGRGRRRLLVVSIGTGVGGAIVLDGRLDRGGHGTAGEVAHLLAPDDGPIPCGCGRRDHLEAHASGPAIAAGYLAAGGAPGEWGTRGSSSGEPDRAALGGLLPGVVKRGQDGDPVARAAILSSAELAGRALAGLASALDVDTVVVGGGVAEIGAGFVDPLRAAFVASVIAPLRDIPVLPAVLGTDAPLLGAAMLVDVADPLDQASSAGGPR